MSRVPPTPIPIERTLDGTIGLERLETTPELARGRVPVAEGIQQPFGLVHGGIYAAIAESLVSAATFAGVYEEGLIAVGLSNHTSFIRPIMDGHVNAEARRRHRGRTTWLWEVELTDDQGRLCALTRVTMAVRPPPGGGR